MLTQSRYLHTFFFSENFLLALSDEYEDDIFCNDNKNGFTKAINRLSTRPDVRIV